MDFSRDEGRASQATAEGERGGARGGAVQRALHSARSRTAQSRDMRRAFGPGGAVQLRGDAAIGSQEVHAAARDGVAGPGGPLPHLDAIQASFGRHDVSGVGAHVGGAAAEANQRIGSAAYATGDQVAFAGAPDLHTAAHEAAHVVQQRAGVQLKGGVGEVGDPYERHADAVADAVVAGQSAEALLDGGPASGGGGEAVQRDAPNVDEMAAMIAQRLIALRPQGAAAVAAEVRTIRAQADSDLTRQAIEQAVANTLNDEERAALEGKAAPTGGEPGGQSTDPDAQGTDPDAQGTDPNAQSTDPNAQGTDPNAQSTDSSQETTNGQNPPGDTGDDTADAQDTPDKQNPDGQQDQNAPADQANQDATATQTPGGGAPPPPAGDAPVTPEQALKPSEPIPPDGRASVEAELAFHENWSALRGGAASRARHLASGLGNDLLQGGKGAATQVGAGLATEFIAKKLPVPGIGNIIGGGFSAMWFAQGGATTALNDIGAGFSALTEGGIGPMQRIADVVQMVKSLMDLVGNICNVLSGLAYVFAGIAALGGLLSVFFPPLAFLVPYIPTAVNFGRMCGGVAQVCIAISNIISPIPPAFRALHIITSNDDPIKLVAQEQKYHGELQGAIANYGSAAVMGGRDAFKAGKSEGLSGKALAGATMKGAASPVKTLAGGFTAGKQGVKEGFGDLKAGNAKTSEALGFSGTKAEQRANGAQLGRQYLGGNKAGLDARVQDEQQQKAREQEAMQKKLDANQEQLNAANDNLARVQQRYPKYNPSKAGPKTQKPSTWPSKGKNKLATYNAERGKALGEAKADVTRLTQEQARLQAESKTVEAHHTSQAGNTAGLRDRAQGTVGGNPQGEAGATADMVRGAMAPGGAPPPAGEAPAEEPQRDKNGHVVLPEPPGHPRELDAIDQKISQMQTTLAAQQANTGQAREHQTAAETNATQLDQVGVAVEQKKGEVTQTEATHQSVQTENDSARSTKEQQGGSSEQGMAKAAEALGPIAGPMRTVNSLVQRVPQNRFFDIGSTQKNLGEMCKAVDEITGAGAENQSQLTNAGTVIEQRSEQISSAGTTHGENVSAAGELTTKVQQDATTTRDVAADAAKQAQTSQQAEKTLEQQIEDEKRKKAEKWSELQSWAQRHFALRSSVK